MAYHRHDDRRKITGGQYDGDSRLDGRAARGRAKVTYYGLADGAPFAIYSADFADGKVSGEHVWQAREDRRLSPLGRRIAAAHAIVLSQTFPLCVAKPFNPVALPPDAHGVLPVYLLTPMVEDGVYPMGGHHEVDVAMDGTIVGQRDFTKSCLPMRDPGGKEKTVGLYVTHVLDAHPTEIHVYLSLWAGIPVYVLTGTTVWEVAGTRIHLVQTTK